MVTKEVTIQFDETQKSVNASVKISTSFGVHEIQDSDALKHLIEEATSTFTEAQKLSFAKTLEKLR